MPDRGDDGRFASEPPPEDGEGDTPPEQTPHAQEPHDPRGSERAPGWFEFQQPESSAERLSREDPAYGQEPGHSQDPSHAQYPSYSQDPESSQEQPAHGGEDTGVHGAIHHDDAQGERDRRGYGPPAGQGGQRQPSPREQGPEYGQPSKYHGQEGWYEQQEGYQPVYATARDEGLDGYGHGAPGHQDSGRQGADHEGTGQQDSDHPGGGRRQGADHEGPGHPGVRRQHLPQQGNSNGRQLPIGLLTAVVLVVVILAVILLTGASSLG